MKFIIEISKINPQHGDTLTSVIEKYCFKPAQLQVDFIDAKLTERELIILSRSMGIGGKVKTLTNIGLNLGFTRERARQIEEKALDKLLEYYERKNLIVCVLGKHPPGIQKRPSRSPNY